MAPKTLDRISLSLFFPHYLYNMSNVFNEKTCGSIPILFYLSIIFRMHIRKYVSRRATPKLCKILLQFFLYKNYDHVIISSLNNSLILRNKFTSKKLNPKLHRIIILQYNRTKENDFNEQEYKYACYKTKLNKNRTDESS